MELFIVVLSCNTHPKTSGRECCLALAINSGSEFRVGLLSNGFHDSSQLLTAHDTDTSVGPHPQESGAVRATAHAIVAGAVAAADDNGELGHVGAGDSGNKLGAVLGDTFAFGSRADHEARDILQEDERDATLGAELNEVGTLDGGRGKENTVVGDDANFLAVNFREAGHQGSAIVSLEFSEFGTVDDACDDFTDWHGLAQVGRGDAEKLLRVVEGLREGLGGRVRRGGAFGPVEVANAAAGENDGVGVVNGEVVGDTRDGRVHLTAAEVFVANDLAGGGLDQGRTGKEDVALLLNNDALIAHGGNVGATGCAGSHDDGDLGDALGAHAGLVIEDATEVVTVGKNVSLVRQVGTTAVDEVNTAIEAGSVSALK